MSDRRKKEEREQQETPARERRMGDRRDSHRLPIAVAVRQGNGPFEMHQGDLGIGGMFFEKALQVLLGTVVQLRFTLPGLEKAVEAMGEVVEISGVGPVKPAGTRVRFLDLDTRSELLIAKFLDERRDG